MDFSLFLTIVAAAVGFIVIIRKFRSHQENKEFDSPSSLSTSSPPPSSLSISTVSPSSTSPNGTYDVFPSFRGEDVRNNILSHIQREFERKGITAFNDNGIKRGEFIGPELISAIRGSKIAIVLVSENYASSKWCLDELVEIMKCKEELGQTLMAIFYKVNPSDVKKLTGHFGKVFRKTCKGKTKEDIGRWRQALEKVATIAGYHLNNWDNEAFMIESITADVLNKLMSSVPSRDFDNLVGMSNHMAKLEELLPLGSNEVKMIGIWGPSGIGKSTIARVLFCQHSHDFQLSVFMENIKTHYSRLGSDDYSAQLELQEKFLSKIFNQKDIKIHHLGVVENRLKDKRVLVVLDDVDNTAQLDALAKETPWFGPGSWIIVTTQDKKILNAHGINCIYEVGFPPADEALQIFCMNAFGQKSPYDGFKKLAWEVTRLAGNLPLGLSVMGSHFKGMSRQNWEEELPSLRTRLDGTIESILKFSYDALCNEDQALFLHIACSFNREPIEKVEEYLADHFACVKRNLRVLAEKSLISITDTGFIRMHDLLARLGREIVREQSPNEPGKHKFLVDAGDISQVLLNTLGRRSVIGIDLMVSNLRTELKVSDGIFEKMSNVQFLRIDFDELIYPVLYELESLNHLPPNLRFLHWNSFPMTCLPSNFNTEFLVEIKMDDSNLEKLWEGTKPIRNLKWMDLSNARYLEELPDLSTATNLLELDLSYCSSLVGLPSSIGNAINLEILNLYGCSSLVEFPSSVWNIVNLRKLDLRGCSSLVRLTSSSGNGIKLKELDLCGCTSLEKLSLDGCSSLVELPFSIRNLHNLQDLCLKGCSKLKALPININMKSLDSLDLTDCSSLKSFPAISTNIRFLKLIGTAIEEIPRSIRSWSRLYELHMSYCENLWESRHAFDCITELHFTDTGIQEIAPWVKEMTRLQSLVIKGCTKLVSLPQLPDSLERIDAENCESLERLNCSNNLVRLNFVDCFKLNQEARDLIIKTSAHTAVFPGEKVPTYFTYRGNGSSLSMKLSGFDTDFPKSLRCKVCVLPVYKGDVEVGHWDKFAYISYCIKDKVSGGVNIKSGKSGFSITSKEHLIVFEIETTVTSAELLFEFEVSNQNWEIEECGVRLLKTLISS